MKTLRVQRLRATYLSSAVSFVALGGCSFLYDFGTQQCNATEDCTKMGPQFAYAVCRRQVCVAQAPPGGTSGIGGEVATTTTSGTTATTGLGGVTSAGATTEQAGAPGTGGSTCRNDRCMLEHDSSWICRNNACVKLTTDDCPVLIPRRSAATLLKQQDVIVIGGYAAMANEGDFYDSQAIINWDLAMDEFNNATDGGLPRHSGGTQRPLVGLICKTTNLDPAAVIRSVQHLTEIAQVPAILSTLSANYLYQAWSSQHSESAQTLKQSFFMSTSSADAKLANLQDDGLVWHMLGDPRALAAPVVTLLKQIEPVVNKRRLANYLAIGADNPATEPLRVTLVYSDEPIMTDIANVLMSAESATHPGTVLNFNRLSWLENGANARSVKIQSARQHSDPDVSAAIAELSEHPPHVIVAMTTYEFPAKVMGSMEDLWRAAGINTVRPTYLMSHLTFNTPQLLETAGPYINDSPPLDARLVGVNFARAQQPHAQELYSAYLSRLRASYQGKLRLDDTENFYDGAYYLLYSLAAAAAIYKNPSGGNIADGLLGRVISEKADAVSVDVGPTPLQTTIPMLFGSTTAYSYSLYGTMGPPNFDRLSGTRLSQLSAWCIQLNSAGSAVEYKSDGLFFDSTSRAFSRPTAGVPSCLAAYCEVLSTEGGTVCRKDY